MFSNHVNRNASAYCHGELSAEDARKFAEHILICTKCRSEFEQIRFGVSLAEHLPIAPAPDHLWSQLEIQLESEHVPDSKHRSPGHAIFPTRSQFAAIAAMLLIFSAIAVIWYRQSKTGIVNQSFWQVTNLDGVPTIASRGFGNNGKLGVGQWLETDGKSRAQIAVGSIGHVEIDPNTRVRLLETAPTEHRLELAEGKLSARIWAPPRLFFVDTPSAVAARSWLCLQSRSRKGWFESVTSNLWLG